MRSTSIQALFLALLSVGQTKPHHGSTPSELDLIAGQHVIYSYSSADPPQELIDLTRQGLVGGILLYDLHINEQTPAKMAELLDAYNESPARRLLRKKYGRDTSLLIMTNQEGGTIFKPLPGYGPDETAREVGASKNPSKAGAKAGREASDALKAYNINVNLAPVMGVYREPGDFLDNHGRSYGTTPKQVIDAAVPFIKEQRKRDILVTIKHFPGLGAAKVEENTDLVPVTLNVPLEELESVDTATFAAAIRSGVDMVMASWAIYPAVDDMPAGLSKTWMKKWLRGKFGFKGVTITEAMEAGSILPYGDIKERSKLAFNAGNDLILASQLNVTEGVEIRQTLVDAVKSGEISRRDFDEATRRVVDLRSRAWN